MLLVFDNLRASSRTPPFLIRKKKKHMNVIHNSSTITTNMPAGRSNSISLEISVCLQDVQADTSCRKRALQNKFQMSKMEKCCRRKDLLSIQFLQKLKVNMYKKSPQTFCAVYPILQTGPYFRKHGQNSSFCIKKACKFDSRHFNEKSA